VEPALEKHSASDDLQADSVASRRRILVSLLGVAFAGIGSVLFGWVADLTFGRDVWQTFVLANFELVIGTPMAAALAFCIVMIFYGSFEGPLKAKLGVLEIEGPAGPILLWTVCFITVVWGISILSKSV
jgi:hypothetical protein